MELIGREFQRIRSSAMARNAGWMMIGQCLGYVLQAIYFLVLARLLGAVQYGIFAGAFAFVNLLGKYSQLGAGVLFLRYVSIDRSSFSTYWGNLLALTTVGGVVMTVLLQVLGSRVLNPASASVVLLAALANSFGTQITACAAQVFQAVEQMKVTAFLNLLTNFLRTLAATGLLLMYHRVSAWEWALAATCVSIIGSIAAVITITVRFGKPTLSIKLLRQRLVEGTSYAFASSTTSAYNDLDKAMLSHFSMNAANGIYTLAYRAIDIASMPVNSLVNAALPSFFRQGANGVRPILALAVRLSKRGLAFSSTSAAAIFVVAPLIPYFVGPGFAETAKALRWLCLIPVFRSIHDVFGFVLTAAGLQRYRTSAQISAVALNFFLNLWLIPRFSWRGAAWSSLATDGILCFLNLGIIKVLLNRERQEAICQSVTA